MLTDREIVAMLVSSAIASLRLAVELGHSPSGHALKVLTADQVEPAALIAEGFGDKRH
jgi:hypothetical protein